jgi:hypothetical protein
MRNERSVTAGFGLILTVAALGLGCSSSATTSTTPSSIPRCAVTLTTGDAPMSASGGAGSVTVSAARECAWTAGVEGAWLRIRSGANGQGDGSVEFTTEPNADPQTRSGAVIVNGQRAQVTQAAGVCDFTLPETSASFPPAGGSRRIDVRSSSALCRWTASSDAPWIAIRSGANGQGNDPVMIDVAATTGPPRTGALTIAGLRFSVTQSQGCAYTIAPQSHSAGSGGGSGTVTIATSAGCPWTAASSDPWISVSPESGAGPGPVTFTIAATTGPTRTGSALIAGHPFSVTQSPGCTYHVEPTTISTSSSGGTANVGISTGTGCTWTATSNAPWVTIQDPTAGTGPGSIRIAVSATTGPSRTGTLMVAGRHVTVTQGTGCSYTIAPPDQSIPSGGGPIDVVVTTAAGCNWTASSATSWITVDDGGNGSGNGLVRLRVAANTGPARSGTATIAGRTFTANQASGCSYTVAPPAIDIAAAGGPARIEVTAATSCAWSAVSSAAWIAVTPPGSGAGNGAIDLAIAANTGPARNGAVTIGGRSVAVNQESGCTLAIDPLSQTFGSAGGTATITVTAGAGCPWTAASSVPWIVVTGGTGSGNGSVQISVEPNGTGAPRAGSVSIGGRLFAVNQE